MVKIKFKIDGYLDIGDSCIKGVRYIKKGGDISDTIEYEKNDIKTDKIFEYRDGLDGIVKTLKLKGKKVIVGLSGREFYVKTLTLIQGIMELEVVKDQFYQDIAGFNLEDYIIDHRLLIEEEFGKKVLLIGIEKKRVEEIERILEVREVDILKIIPDFLKLDKEVVKGIGRLGEKDFCIIDIGGSSTKVLRYHNGKLGSVKVLEFGGDTITNIFQDEFYIGFKEGEERKKKIKLNSEIEGKKVTLGEISLRKKIEERIEEFRRTIIKEIANEEGLNPIKKIYITGGGGELEGFIDILNKSDKEFIKLKEVELGEVGEREVEFYEFFNEKIQDEGEK